MRVVLAAILLASCGSGEDPAPLPPPVVPTARPSALPAPSPRGPEHAVFSLVDNRHLAHAYRDGALVVHAGAAGFPKYLPAGGTATWTPGRHDGRLVARPERYATLELPLGAGAEAADVLFVRLYSPAPGPMSLNLPGERTPVATVELATGWQTASLRIPTARIMSRGSLSLQLSFARDNLPAVEWLQLGGPPPPDALPALVDAESAALVVAERMTVTYLVAIPAAGRLVGDVGPAGCEIAARATAAKGSPIAGVLSGAGAALDLSPLAGHVARLELTVKGCREARLGGAALAIPGPRPTLPATAKPKHVVLWVMDALRADRVRVVTPGARPEIPVLERLAASGAVFTSAYAQSSEDRASYSSLWSSTYPATHGLEPGDPRVFEPTWTTMGESMSHAGYTALGVSANGHVADKWGFAEGFQVLRNHIHERRGLIGGDVWDTARRLVDRRLDQPTFLYVGTIDTHVPWRAKDPWIARLDPEPYRGPFATEASALDIDRVAAGRLPVGEREKRRIIALYDSNVSYQDEVLGRLVADLEGRGLLDDTLIVVTSDHGDEQWDDGRTLGYAPTLRSSSLRVPLVIHYPALFPPGEIVEAVEIIDVLPTLLAAAGMSPPEEAQGGSLLPLVSGEGRGYPRPAFASRGDGHTVRLGAHKLTVGRTGEPALYDVVADPAERQNIAATAPLERQYLADVLAIFLAHETKWKKSRWGVVANATRSFAVDVER